MAKVLRSKKGLYLRIAVHAVGLLATIYGLWWGLEWSIRNFFWISEQPWGRVEFVVASIGINMALAGWKGFRDQLKKALVDIEQKSDSFETYKIDQPDKAANAQVAFFKFSSFAITAVNFYWRIAPLFAVMFVGVGAFSLYTEWYCPWLVVMMLPIPVYAVLGWLSLLWIGLVYHINFLRLHSQSPGDITASIKEFKKKLDLDD